MEQSIVSIIVPVYNVASYLEQCLDSIKNQTYQNLQIVLVDDGSDDESGLICDRYAEADQRFLTIHKQNGGLSSARQMGVAAVSGEYTMFVDADDWIELDTVERCIGKIKKYDADCVLFSYVKEYPGKSVVIPVMNKDYYFAEDDAKKKVYRRLYGPLDDELRHPERLFNLETCDMKLYKTELVKKGQYFDTKEVGSSEDGLFNMDALYECDSFYYINQPFYHYRKGTQSLTSTYRPQLMDQWEKLFEIMRDMIEKKKLSKVYTEALQNRIACSVIAIGMNEIAGEGNLSQRKNRIKGYLNRDYVAQACILLKTESMPLIWKIFFFCVKHQYINLICLQLYAMNILKRIK